MEAGLGRVSELAGTSETREDEEAPVQEEGEEGLDRKSVGRERV